MKKVAVLSAAIVGIAGTALASNGGGVQKIREFLNGHQEVPVVSSTGKGTFTATINRAGTEIKWVLRYADLEGEVQQAHIHFGPPNNTGGISAFLCSNLPNPPVGTAPCPLPDGQVEGVITANEIIGPAAQGIEAGEIEELVAAIRAGKTYVNVHSSKWPAGEIRSQISAHDQHGGHR